MKLVSSSTWILLTLAFAGSAAVEAHPGVRESNAWRTVQALCFTSALLLMAVSRWGPADEAGIHRGLQSTLLSGTGLVLLGSLFPMGPARLVLAMGLALQLAAILLLSERAGAGAGFLLKSILGLGVLLDLTASLVAAELIPGGAAWLGPDEGLRWRFLRLARAACAALPVLVLLFGGLHVPNRAGRVARRALLGGAFGMPVLLVACAVVHPGLKYGLFLPADALVVGAGIAAVLACRTRPLAATAGWTLVLASMLAGLLMGGYSFDGPLPPPSGLARYSDPARVVLRLAHAYAILVGVTLIWAAGPTKLGTTLPAS